MISVVIPLFNQEKYIERAIKSVLSQTFQGFEIIIVDDGSSDSSAVIAMKSGDSRVKLWSQKNAGVSAARNRGIQISKYDIVAFLDSDDEWLPNHLEQINYLSENFSSCSVYASRYQIIINENFVKDIQINGLKNLNSVEEIENYFDICAKSDPLLWSSAVAVKKEAIIDVGGFPEGITSGEDLVTWAKLACKYRIAYYNCVSSRFHFNRPEQKIPKRKPDSPDLVGKELKSLEKKFDLISLRRYRGWYKKNRAVHAFESGYRFECIKSCILAFYLLPKDIKAVRLLVLPFIPRFFYFYRKHLIEKNNDNRR